MDDESVLNALLREGVDIPYGCQTGVCQSCIMKTEHSVVPRDAQKGLREVQKQQGYFPVSYTHLTLPTTSRV